MESHNKHLGTSLDDFLKEEGLIMSFSTVSKKSGKTFYLHSKEVMFSGAMRLIYFFKSNDSEEGTKELPEGWEVTESPRTGLPLLRKIQKPTL